MRFAIRTFVVLAVLTVLTVPVMAQEATGGLRYTITVEQFENEAGWHGQWDIGNAWGTVLTDLLFDSGRFIVLAESDMRGAALDEQDLAASGRAAQGAKAPATGHLTPAQILVKGAITHVQSDASSGGGGIRIKGLRLGGKKKGAEINVTIYMVDSTTGQVLSSHSVIGKAKGKGASVGYSTYDWGASFGGEKNDNLGVAVAAAAGVAVEWLVAELPSVPWRGTVVLVRDGRVYINRGSREGVALGQQFVVGTTEVIRDPGTGEILDEIVSEIARLEVASVKEKLSICNVVSGDAAALEPGLGVQLPPS